MKQVNRLAACGMATFLGIVLVGCPLPSSPPTADYEAYIPNDAQPLTIQFSDKTIPVASVTSWSWTFGDTKTSREKNPLHTYDTPGTYPVRLTVAGPAGADSVVKNWTVGAVDGVPTANFEALPAGGPAPIAVTFTDLSVPGAAAITEWLWDFGDGETSTQQNPIHTFTRPNTYTVTMTARNLLGADTKVFNSCVVVTAGCPETAIAPIGETNMVTVHEGFFWMGQNNSGSLVRHGVNLCPYLISAYEVTNRQFAEVFSWAYEHNYLKSPAGDNVYSTQGNHLLLVNDTDTHCRLYWDVALQTFLVDNNQADFNEVPVVGVTWWGAIAFCNWLSEMRGLTPCYDLTSGNRKGPVPNGYRLPTEAEWERAARWVDSSTPPYDFGFQNNQRTSERVNMNTGWHYIDGQLGPLPVGYFNGHHSSTEDSRSFVGCYDMSGNVAEWCEDWYDQDIYQGSTGTVFNPCGPGIADKALRKVVRGGAYGVFAYAYDREYSNYETASQYLGFRIVRN